MAIAYGSNASASNQIYAGEGANVGVMARVNSPVSPTLSSAISKVDGVNTRLLEAIKQLQSIHDQIGGPRPVSTGESSKGIPEPGGAVGRLNFSAERSHEYLGEIEGLISLVARALG